MPNSARNDPSELSVQQLNSIDLLASGVGVAKAAEILGVNRHTVARWRTTNPFYIARLNAKRKELWSDAHERLRGMVNKAIDVMEAALNGGDSKVAVELLKATNIYANIGAPRGSTNSDEILAEMAGRYAKELIAGQPSSDPTSQALYLGNMLPTITAEVYYDMKDNIEKYTGDDDDVNTATETE